LTEIFFKKKREVKKKIMAALPDFRGIYRSFRSKEDEEEIKKQAIFRLVYFIACTVGMATLRLIFFFEFFIFIV